MENFESDGELEHASASTGDAPNHEKICTVLDGSADLDTLNVVEMDTLVRFLQTDRMKNIMQCVANTRRRNSMLDAPGSYGSCQLDSNIDQLQRLIEDDSNAVLSLMRIISADVEHGTGQLARDLARAQYQFEDAEDALNHARERLNVCDREVFEARRFMDEATSAVARNEAEVRRMTSTLKNALGKFIDGELLQRANQQ